MQPLKHYTNYREYLADAYRERKEKDPRFSYRRLAELVGFKTAGFFTRILKGEKNISPEMVERFARFLVLSPKEGELFRQLVRFNQARTHEEKKAGLAGLLNGRHSWLKQTAATQFRFYEKWYYPLIREIMNVFPFRGDYRKLARSIVPPISPREAIEAVRFLEGGGFLKKGPDGRYGLVDRFLNAGPDVATVSIHTFQLAMMDLAKKALERFPPAERDISTLTVAVSREGAERMKERLAEMRTELLEIAKADGRVDRVFQINLQLFPVSAPKEEGA